MIDDLPGWVIAIGVIALLSVATLCLTGLFFAAEALMHEWPAPEPEPVKPAPSGGVFVPGVGEIVGYTVSVEQAPEPEPEPETPKPVPVGSEKCADE